MPGPRPWLYGSERCPPLLSPRKRRFWGGGSEGTMMLRFLRRTFGRRSMQRHAGRGGFRAGRDERDGGAVGMRAAAPVTSPPGGFYSHPNYHSPPVHSGGATVHIPAAGDSKSVLTCKVQLLDGTDVSVDLPVRPSAFPQLLIASSVRHWVSHGRQGDQEHGKCWQTGSNRWTKPGTEGVTGYCGVIL